MNEIEVAVNCQLIELIKETYPIAFITTFGGFFGGSLSFIPRLIRNRSLERQLGISKKDAKEQ